MCKELLSVVDLAELSATVGDDFRSFSKDTTQLIKDGEYKVVSDARSNVREFATSSKIDQIDLVNFAQNLGTEEGKALAKTLLSSVKYNRTSPNMTDAYGISVYFPYRKTSSVSKAVNTYDQIGLDSEYSSCIREFAVPAYDIAWQRICCVAGRIGSTEPRTAYRYDLNALRDVRGI